MSSRIIGAVENPTESLSETLNLPSVKKSREKTAPSNCAIVPYEFSKYTEYKGLENEKVEFDSFINMIEAEVKNKSLIPSKLRPVAGDHCMLDSVVSKGRKYRLNDKGLIRIRRCERKDRIEELYFILDNKKISTSQFLSLIYPHHDVRSIAFSIEPEV